MVARRSSSSFPGAEVFTVDPGLPFASHGEGQALAVGADWCVHAQPPELKTA